MLLVDVNVLVYAHRRDANNHSAYQRWLEASINSDQPFGMADIVLSGFIRIVTHPGIYRFPTPIVEAFRVASNIRSRPNCVMIAPGPRHWDIFGELCGAVQVRGSLVPDAYLAALAIESGSEWITADRDYARFPGLRWRHPLD